MEDTEFKISFAVDKIQAMWKENKQNVVQLEDHEQNQGSQEEQKRNSK